MPTPRVAKAQEALRLAVLEHLAAADEATLASVVDDEEQRDHRDVTAAFNQDGMVTHIAVVYSRTRFAADEEDPMRDQVGVLVIDDLMPIWMVKGLLTDGIDAMR